MGAAYSIIDTHVHLSDIKSFHDTADQLSHVRYSPDGLEAEFVQNGVVLGIGMGLSEKTAGEFPDASASNPMTLDLLPESWSGPLSQRSGERPPPILLECPGVNPARLADPDFIDAELDVLERRLQRKTTAGIKIYAGYYHYHVHDTVYEPVYALAKKYKLPVVIHTGDTYSQKGLLKYSHPLHVDELAVKHRELTFIICHLGDPWVMDGAEIVYKNDNVFADLSGLLVGDRSRLNKYVSEPLMMDHFRRALVYADVYEKMLFGSDWPLAPIDVYIEFVRHLIPDCWQEAVFYSNAKQAFPIIKAWL